MHGWMDTCMTAWMMHRCMDVCVSGCLYEQRTLWRNDLMDECLHVWMHAWMLDRCVVVDIYIDTYMEACMNKYHFTNSQKVCYNLSQWMERLFIKCQVIKLQFQMKNLGKKNLLRGFLKLDVICFSRRPLYLSWRRLENIGEKERSDGNGAVNTIKLQEKRKMNQDARARC